MFIFTNFDDFFNAGFVVNIDVTDALAVAEHRNALSSTLDIPDQLRRATGNYQINHFLQTTQILHLFSCAHLQQVATHFTFQKITDTKQAAIMIQEAKIYTTLASYQLDGIFDTMYG